MKSASLSEVEAHLGAYVDRLAEGPVVITKDGRPVAALVSVSDDDDLEQLELAQSTELRSLLTEAAVRIARGERIEHDSVRRAVEAMDDATEDRHG